MLVTWNALTSGLELYGALCRNIPDKINYTKLGQYYAVVPESFVFFRLISYPLVALLAQGFYQRGSDPKFCMCLQHE